MTRENTGSRNIRYFEFFCCGLQLSVAIEVWEPRSGTVGLHAWVHTWLAMPA